MSNGYEPMPGDVVTFGMDSTVRVHDREAVLGAGATSGWWVLVPTTGECPRTRLADQFAPKRPDCAGQRVRLGSRYGRTEACSYASGAPGSVSVQWDNHGGWEFVQAASLVCVAEDAGKREAAIAQADPGPPEPGEWSEVQVPASIAAALEGVADVGSVRLIERDAAPRYELRWSESGVPHGLRAGSPASLSGALGQRRAMGARGIYYPDAPPLLMQLPSESAAPVLSPPKAGPSRPGAWTCPPPPCGSRSHATRLPNTTCVHFWPCGCAVEPEGEDALGEVNGEPRGVMVWGQGASGRGFTRDEAVAEWRDSLAWHQTAGDALAAQGHTVVPRTNAEWSDMFHEWKRAQKKAAAKTEERDRAVKAVVDSIAEYHETAARFARYDYGDVGKAIGAALWRAKK